MELFNFEKVEFSSSHKSYVIILKNCENKKTIPILISSNEAQSLSLTNENIKLPRPRSNELFLNLLNKIEGNIKSILINKYENGIFFAILNIKVNQSIINLDCKPSNAIEIAIKENAPLYISQDVLNKINFNNIIEEQTLNEGYESFNQNVDISDIKDNLIDALNKSIIEENYEIAAKLRDRINKLKT